MNPALYSIGSCHRLALTVAFVSVWVASAIAEESQLYVFWDTVSPDGKYAMAWSTSGKVAVENLPLPDQTTGNPVTNYVIEVASRKILVRLPESHYWDLDGRRPNHFSLETVWSENSRSMLAIYNSRWSTYAVFLVDVSVPKAIRIENQLEASFKQTLRSTQRRHYAKYRDRLEVMFRSPWFVAPERFYVTANASIPKQENPNFDFGLYFQIQNGGTNVRLVKSEPSSGEESADRLLNRTYRKLQGLLSAVDQKSLAEEERAWLIKRDAINSESEKKAFIVARAAELQTRLQNILETREGR